MPDPQKGLSDLGVLSSKYPFICHNIASAHAINHEIKRTIGTLTNTSVLKSGMEERRKAPAAPAPMPQTARLLLALSSQSNQTLRNEPGPREDGLNGK